jgi:hypothetical protein
VPAHALMSLRGRKYEDEWDPVWQFLAERHGFPGPLGLDEAVEDIVAKLTEQKNFIPGRVKPTVYELIGEAHLIGLRQDHLQALAEIVEGDEARRSELLEHATEHLGWDRKAMVGWSELSAPESGDEAEEESLTRLPPLRLGEDASPVSLHQWTQSLVNAGLLTTPIPDATCTSGEVSGGIDGGATKVFGRFELDAGLNDLAYATNPLNWPQCSWFFISMTQLGQSLSLLPPDDVGNTAYTCDLEELVGLEDVLTVRTGLTSRYFVGNASLGMEFDLAPGTHGDGKIDVDHGYLLAEKHPKDPGKLIVTSQKTFSFVGLNDLPFSFLCEFGWIDMMRAMALCRAPGGGTP